MRLNRGFDAAGGGLLWGFQGDLASLNQDIAGGGLRVMRRARKLKQNNPIMQAYVRAMKTQVVGSKPPVLQSVHPRFATEIETHWKAWCQRGVMTLCGRQSALGLARLMTEALATDGEIFLRKVTHRALPMGLGLEIIESPDIPHEKSDYTLPFVAMGIELDGAGRPLAYHRRLPKHPMQQGTELETIRVPAAEIIHILAQDIHGLVRGYPPTAPVMTMLNLIDKLDQASVIAAIKAASYERFFEWEEWADDGEFEDGLSDDDSAADTSGFSGKKGKPLSLELVDSDMRILPRGLRATQLASQYPNVNHDAFVGSLLHRVASALGVSYATLTADITKGNFSSQRYASDIERETYATWQTLQTDGAWQPIFNWWVTTARLQDWCPWKHETDDAALTACRWRWRSWQYVEPVKQRQADQMDLEMGLTSRTRLASKRGEDLEQIQAELAKETTDREGTQDETNDTASQLAAQRSAANVLPLAPRTQPRHG